MRDLRVIDRLEEVFSSYQQDEQEWFCWFI